MRFFETSTISQNRLERIVGPKTSNAVKGSPGMFVQAYQAEKAPVDLQGAKANFEIREAGLLMYISKSHHRLVFPIPSDEMKDMELSGGEERIKLLWISPMRMLMKLGVSKRYARYFRLRDDEYSITPMILKLATHEMTLTLECSGYNNYSLTEFMEQFKSRA